jgi:hypothetical protein
VLFRSKRKKVLERTDNTTQNEAIYYRSAAHVGRGIQHARICV